MRSSMLLTIACCVCVPGPPAPADVVYCNDFEVGAGSEWTDTSTDVTPTGRTFLGEFQDETVGLSLTDLPPHSEVTVSFEFFVIRSWDGNGENGAGPDILDLTVNGGPTLLHATFSNSDPPNTQSYPDDYPGPTNPGYTGACEVGSLGYPASNNSDSAYKLSFTFAHGDDSLQLDFTGLLQPNGPLDEAWGIDNIQVEVSLPDPYEGLMAYYPFDDDTLDHSCFGNDGANMGATFVDDTPFCAGQALSFDGIDDVVKLTYPLALNCTDYSIAFWMKSTQEGNYIVHSWAPNTGQPENEEESLIISAAGDTLLHYQSGEGLLAADIPLALVADGTWHHVTFTRRVNDMLSSSYVDGAFYASANFTRAETVPEETALGGSAGDPIYNPGAFYEGLLDDVRVYNRVLTDAEIQALSDFEDCNTNGIPDTCDIASSTSEDTDTNGIPDECEAPSLCDYLGDSCWPGMRDIDLYTFEGSAGEDVTIHLDRGGGDDGSDERATLVLMSWPCVSVPCRLFRMDRSALPNQVSATLPCDGRYLVLVKEQPAWMPGEQFTGYYCLTMDASGDAASTFEGLHHGAGHHAPGAAEYTVADGTGLTRMSADAESVLAGETLLRGAVRLTTPGRGGDDLDLDGNGRVDLSDLEALMATLNEQ